MEDESTQMQGLPNVFAKTIDIFGFDGDYRDEMELDGYSSCDDDTNKNSPNYEFTAPSPPISPTPDTLLPTRISSPLPADIDSHPNSEVHVNQLSAQPEPTKTVDPKRSKAAQIREQKKREQNVAEEEESRRHKQTEEKTRSTEEAGRRVADIKLVLKQLNDLGLTMGDLVCYFFNPENQCNRWEGFWKEDNYFDELIENITTRKNATPSGRARVQRWAINYVKRTVRSEARAITTRRHLQSRHLPIDEDFVLGFRLQDMEDRLVEFCPVMLEVTVWFGTSAAQERAMKNKKDENWTTKLHKRKVATTAMLSLLREYNQHNNRFQQILAVFMYASGLQRQCFSILSRLGIVVTYTSLVRTIPRRQRHTTVVDQPQAPQAPLDVPQQRLGLLVELSLAMQRKACMLVLAVVVAIVYDNINFTSRVGEQTAGHTDTQENGTCATVYVVPGVSKDDLDVKPYHEKLLSAPLLKLDDLALTAEEYCLEQESLVLTILGVLVEHGGDFFSRYKKLVDSELPKLPLAGAYTPYPLPAMNVNEGSVDGNLDVYETITKEVAQSGGPITPGFVKMMLGDQFSMALTRRGIAWRVGNEDDASSMNDIALGPGLFHLLMILTTLILENFWGLPNSEANPASLSAHNTLLGRRPITLSSPPKFRDALDLVTVSLYSRIIHTLPLAAGKKDVQEYTHTVMT